MWKETLCQGPRPRAGRLLPSGPGARPGNGQDLRGLGGSTQPRPRASAPGQTPRGLWGSWPCGLPIRPLPRLSRSPIFLLQVRVPRLTEDGQEPLLQLAGWPVCSEACLLPGSVLAFLSCQPGTGQAQGVLDPQRGAGLGPFEVLDWHKASRGKTACQSSPAVVYAAEAATRRPGLSTHCRVLPPRWSLILLADRLHASGLFL